MKRPIVFFVLALIGGTIFGLHGESVLYTLLFILVLAVLRPLFSFHTKYSLPAYLILLCFTVGILNGATITSRIEDKVGPITGKSLLWQGKVLQISYGSETDHFLLETEGFIKEDTLSPYSLKMRVYISEKLNGKIKSGDTIRLFLTPQKLSGKRYPGDFGKEYHYARGVSTIAYTTPNAVFYVKSAPVWDYHRLCGTIQRFTAERLRTNLSQEHYAMITALLIGERSELSTETTETIRSSGLSHLIAVSGSHFAILMSFLEFFAIFTIRKRKHLYPFLIISALLFMGVVGFSPAVTRAGLTVLLSLAAGVMQRKPDSINNLFIIVGVMVFARPYLLEDVSFLLSVCATLSSYLFSNEIRQKNPLLRSFYKSFSASFFAFVGIVPVCLYFFREVSPVTLISTPIAMPLVTLSMLFGILIVLGFSFLAAPLSGFLELFIILSKAMGTGIIPSAAFPVISRELIALLVAFYIALYVVTHKRNTIKEANLEI